MAWTVSPVTTAPKTTLLLSLREQQCLHSCGPRLVHTLGRSTSREISPREFTMRGWGTERSRLRVKSASLGMDHADGPGLRRSRTRHSFPGFSSCSRLEKRTRYQASPLSSWTTLQEFLQPHLPPAPSGVGGSSGLCRGWPWNQRSGQDASWQEDTQMESIISITVSP